MDCQGLFAIVSPSFSGSTLLNFLLGSHSMIAGGGELYHLTLADGERRICLICGENCPVWTTEIRQEVRPDNLYHMTARAFSRPFVCDASKMLEWYRVMLPMHGAIPQANLLLVKHPIRHVSSHVQKARQLGSGPEYADYRHVLWHLCDSYYEIRRDLKIDLVVKYEELVTDTKAVLSKILALHGLSYEPRMAAWREQNHHHIDGNAGPLSQIIPSMRPVGEFLQRKYARTDIFLDNSFREVLSEQEFEEIQQTVDFELLCKQFGYEPLPITAMRHSHVAK